MYTIPNSKKVAVKIYLIFTRVIFKKYHSDDPVFIYFQLWDPSVCVTMNLYSGCV